MTDWLKEALEIEPELIELRHTLHRRPEEGNHEFFTSDLLISELEKLETIEQIHFLSHDGEYRI